MQAEKKQEYREIHQDPALSHAMEGGHYSVNTYIRRYHGVSNSPTWHIRASKEPLHDAERVKIWGRIWVSPR